MRVSSWNQGWQTTSRWSDGPWFCLRIEKDDDFDATQTNSKITKDYSSGESDANQKNEVNNVTQKKDKVKDERIVNN